MSNQPKLHVALNVNQFDQSVQFYRALFGQEPVKLKPGYAKFDLSEPPVNLTLNYDGHVVSAGALNHFGIQVDTSAAVLEAKERLRQLGLATYDEMNVDCCYAIQDKIWIKDPNGYPWEIFVVKVADTAPQTNAAVPKASAPLSTGSCCAPTCCAS
jgi:catechol 2,3-dioxygenase-like lactoylglutathione lyase family enzyme